VERWFSVTAFDGCEDGKLGKMGHDYQYKAALLLGVVAEMNRIFALVTA
jgi:hypothetical protein